MQPAVDDARRDKRGGVLNYYYYYVQEHSFQEEEDDAMSVAINHQTTALPLRCHRVVVAAGRRLPGIPSQCIGLNSN